MHKEIKLIVLILVCVIAVGTVLWVFQSSIRNSLPLNATDAEQASGIKATFICDGGKTIDADFLPDRNVMLKLSDGRDLTLPQALSASGARFANTDESFVFWNKGDTAFITEGKDGSQTYSNCIEEGQNGQDQGLQTYSNPSLGFSVQYPRAYSVNEGYVYTGLGPNKDIEGVSFIIPQSEATGTNLSSDSYVSVEEIPGAKACSAQLFFYDKVKPQTLTEGDTTYSVASSSGAGAGNFYQETVYAIPGTSPCMAVRYLIHSTNIGNYDPGTVTEFDKNSLISEFEAIRKSLVIAK